MQHGMSTENSMVYPLFEMNRLASQPFRLLAETSLAFWGHAANPWRGAPLVQQATAALTMFERATRHYEKPSFGIEQIEIAGKAVAVNEQMVWQTPFCKLLHFAKPDFDRTLPKLLLVAPLSLSLIHI